MADKGRKNGPMRLDRFLAEMGYGTRTQVKDMVKKGRVRVNAEAVKDADRKVNPESDLIEVDRSQVAYARMEYYMLNKPQGVVSATEDRKYPTVVGLIREALRKDLFPVGRLDIDTEGLLLITNDGDLAHNLLSPKKHVDKVYLAGGFGYRMDVEKAVGIGLIPEVFADKIRVIGNGALEGAVRYGREEGAMDLAEDIVKISSEIGLSSDKAFNDLYMKHMYFECS